MTPTMIPTHAWVESPLQLLCAIEYAAASGIPLRILPLRGALQLDETVRRVTALGLPAWVSIERPRRSPFATFVSHPHGHWVVGDAYSRVTRLALALGQLRWLTVVDDGAITRSVVAVIRSGAPLERPGKNETRGVRFVAERARRRLVRLAVTGRLEIFSFYPLALPMLRAHRFEWLRSRDTAAERLPSTPDDGSRVILGSASVVDGSQSESDYSRWLSDQKLPAVYYPHRRETAPALQRISLIEGLTISLPGLPIELVLAPSRDLHIASQPSSALTTLGIILSERDCSFPSLSMVGSLVTTVDAA